MHIPTNRKNSEYYHNVAIVLQIEMAVIFAALIVGVPLLFAALHGALIAFGIKQTKRYIRGLDRPIKSVKRFLSWYLLCHIPKSELYRSSVSILNK